MHSGGPTDGRRGPTPLPLRIAAKLLPADAREEILGDLLEHWRRHVRHRRLPARWMWAWRQPLSALRDRLRFGARPAPAVLPSRLDVELGLRMIVRHPGLTLVGTLSISIAVAGAAGFGAFSGNFTGPSLPLDEGDRVVALQSWNVQRSAPEMRVLHDFVDWRAELEAVRELGAATRREWTLATDDGGRATVRAAEVTASAFQVVRLPPMLGRPLVEADEREDAADVAVIGYGLWQDLFGGDPGVLGRRVRLAGLERTIVGVMPAAFGFPFNERVWVPLQYDPLDWERLEGPPIIVFGRLAEGATLEQAHAELSALGARTAAERPDTHASLRPRVLPYAEVFTSAPLALVLVTRTLLLMLLLVVCANVGALVFARNAAREREIVVRAALGASRGRIVLQLFVESLALASLAALVGLALTSQGLRVALDLAGEELFGSGGPPFWWRGGLAPGTVSRVAGFTLLAAVVTGLLPALGLTTGVAGPGLQRPSAGGSARRFGRVATWAIACQVAFSIALLALVLGQAPYSLTNEIDVRGLGGASYLTAALSMDGAALPRGDAARRVARDTRIRTELEDRLLAEPEVSAVVFASDLPGTEHVARRVEVEGLPGGTELLPVRIAAVEPTFFSALGAPVLAGRAFDSGDLTAAGSPRPVAVVNEPFVRARMGAGGAVGRRVRIVSGGGHAGPWLEIVGVVPDFGMNLNETTHPEGLYVPLGAAAFPLSVAVRAGSGAMRLAPRLREVAADVEPMLRVERVMDLEAVVSAARARERAGYLTFAALATVAVLLSLSGVNALMSFTVTQRTREIGVRRALGAHPLRLVVDLSRRALLQVALGVALGGVVTALISGTIFAEDGVLLFVEVAGVVVGAGLLSCAVPARRALRVQPTEAMRAE